MQILPLYKYHSKKGIGWIMILKEEPILCTVYTNTKTPKFTPQWKQIEHNFMIRHYLSDYSLAKFSVPKGE